MLIEALQSGISVYLVLIFDFSNPKRKIQHAKNLYILGSFYNSHLFFCISIACGLVIELKFWPWPGFKFSRRQRLSATTLPFCVAPSQSMDLHKHLYMSCPSWQWHRTGSSWSPVRTLPVAPLWCDLGFIQNSCGNKAAANHCPIAALSISLSWNWPVVILCWQFWILIWPSGLLCFGALAAWPLARGRTPSHVLAWSLGSYFSYCTASQIVVWPFFFLTLEVL